MLCCYIQYSVWFCRLSISSFVCVWLQRLLSSALSNFLFALFRAFKNINQTWNHNSLLSDRSILPRLLSCYIQYLFCVACQSFVLFVFCFNVGCQVHSAFFFVFAVFRVFQNKKLTAAHCCTNLFASGCRMCVQLASFWDLFAAARTILFALRRINVGASFTVSSLSQNYSESNASNERITHAVESTCLLECGDNESACISHNLSI